MVCHDGSAIDSESNQGFVESSTKLKLANVVYLDSVHSLILTGVSVGENLNGNLRNNITILCLIMTMIRWIVPVSDHE